MLLMKKRNGLPKLADFEDATLYQMKHFWDFYNRDAAFGQFNPGPEPHPANTFGLDPFVMKPRGKNQYRNLGLTQAEVTRYNMGHGVYIISDAKWVSNGRDLTQWDGNTIPIEQVIYVGQAGADSKGEKSNFHERIFKHALAVVGIHSGKYDEPVVKKSGIVESAYWKSYRDTAITNRRLNWLEDAPEDVTLPIDDWFISLITMPSSNPQDKFAIKVLEDFLMLGVSALRDVNQEPYERRFEATLPICNSQFALNVINDVFDHEWL